MKIVITVLLYIGLPAIGYLIGNKFFGHKATMLESTTQQRLKLMLNIVAVVNVFLIFFGNIWLIEKEVVLPENRLFVEVMTYVLWFISGVCWGINSQIKQ